MKSRSKPGVRVVSLDEVPGGLLVSIELVIPWEDVERLHKDIGVELEERARFLETAVREGAPA